MKQPLKRQNAEVGSLRHQLDGRDELNLAEFPIALLTDSVPKGCKTVYFEDRITDRETGESISRKMTMTGSDEYGLPTAVDGDVLFALIQISKYRYNFSTQRISFSRYELIKLLGWEDESKSYKRIEDSLHTWAGVTYYYTAWRDKESEKWTNETFHMIDNVSVISKSRRRSLLIKGQSELALSSFKWNDVVFKSFQAGYLRPLDLSVYYSLRSSISKQMYRYLDKHFDIRKSENLTFKLNQFAFEKVGLSRKYDTGRIKEKLKPAIEELVGARFLVPMKREEQYFKDGLEWKIRFKLTADAKAKIKNKEIPTGSTGTASLDLEVTPAPPPNVVALMNRGVSSKSATELAEIYPSTFVEAKIEEFDWEMTQPKPPKKPAGYLVKSIRDGYATDPEFVSTAEQQRREEARHASQQEAAITRRQQQQREAARDHALKAADDHLKGLSPAERTALEAEALAAASPQARQNYELPTMRRHRDTLMIGMLREHLQPILKEK